MKPLEQYFHKVLFIYFVVLTFESVDETVWCDHSYEISWAVSKSTIYELCSSNFWVCGQDHVVTIAISHDAFVFHHFANKCSLEISSRFDF